MRRLAFPRALPLLVAAVALALGGCDSATEGAGPATPRGSSPGPEDDVTRWVEAAKITPDPGALLHDTTGGPGPTTACDAVTAAGAQVGYAHTWWWADGETSYLEHFVGVYDLPGADIIDLHERRSNECPSLQYRYQGGAAESTVSQTLADPEVAGSDGSYAYCEKSVTLEPAEHRGEESATCHALLSRGRVVTMVSVLGDGATYDVAIDSAKQKLATAVALAGPALVAAVPVN